MQNKNSISRFLRLAMIFVAFTVGGFCLFQAGDGRLFNEPAVASTEIETVKPQYIMKSVADFKAGDTILAFNHKTGKHEKSVVVQAFSRTSDHLRILTFLTQAGEEQRIKTTDEHPFWSIDKRDYIKAEELNIGNSVRSPDGSILWLAKTIYEPHSEGIAVYNLEVKGYHNYFVKAQGSRAPPVLAHNAPCAQVFPNTADEMDNLMGFRGTRKPDMNLQTGQPLPGRGRVDWDISTPQGKMRITYESHPYHTTAPDFHQNPHYHLNIPGTPFDHTRFSIGDVIPGFGP